MSVGGPLEVPGFDLLAATDADRYRCRDAESGALVDLHRLGRGDDTDRRRATAVGTALAAIDSAHLQALRRLLVVGSELVVVTDPTPHLTLESLLARRTPLRPSESVTVGVGIAHGLAALHAVGLAAGDASPRCIGMEAGRPVLLRPAFESIRGYPATDPGGWGDPARGDGFGSAASDVYELALTCARAVGGGAALGGPRPREVPPALWAAWQAALADDPERRPNAAELADLLLASCTAEPVRVGRTAPRPAAPPVLTPEPPPAPQEVFPERPHAFPSSAPGTSEAGVATLVSRPRPEAPARRPLGVAPLAPATVAAAPAVARAPTTSPGVSRRRGRPAAGRPLGRALGRALLAVCCCLAGAGVVGAAVALTGPAEPPGAAAAGGRVAVPPPAVAPDWRSVVAALDAKRSAAFAQGDAALLREVYAPGSPALRRDLRALSDVLAQGVRPQDLAPRIDSVVAGKVTNTEVELRVVDRLGPVRLVDIAGQVRERRPSRGNASWLVTLHAVGPGPGWRVHEIAVR